MKSEPGAFPANDGMVSAAPAPIRFGSWNIYFLAKFALFWKGLIGFHTYENLAFAAFLLVPAKSPLWRRVKTAVAVPLGVALLYYDSWLPPIGRVLSQASLLAHFDLSYLLELIGRFVSWPIVAMLILAWAAYQIVSRWIRVGAIVMGALIVMAITHQEMGSSFARASVAAAAGKPAGEGAGQGGGSEGKLDAALQNFYNKESLRAVSFPTPPPGAVPFDVIFVHICSLAWDDVRAVGLENHPLWQRFDVVLTRFNSASSYSGPAAIRVLRATCGQTSHAGLYSPVPDRCYLMDSLKRSGFEPNLVMNHDGHFDDFLKLLQIQGKLTVPAMPLNGIPVAQHAFDDSPVFDDLAVLSRWLDTRQKDGVPRVAAYYNTISLHDGNHLVGPDSNRNSLDTYKIRLTRLFDDLDKFMQKIESSGRRAVVVMVPEHGAALRGDKMQIPGLREIPSPAITLVPVGIKVVGPNLRREGDSLRIDAPTSYLAVSQIIARMLAKSPFAGDSFAPSDYVNELPTTDFVSENEGMVVMRRDNRYYLRQGNDGWAEYSGSLPAAGGNDGQIGLDGKSGH
ncbi:MAG: cellulose biosynthesis protein BcsG [Burkholderiales bacterium]